MRLYETTHTEAEIKRAQKHVARVKAWYWLIPMNVLVTATLATLSWLMYANDEPNTIIYILMSGPMALWVIFSVTGFALFNKNVLSSWEERQIEKYMKE